MIIKPNPSLGVPIYLQLMEQVKHAIETGALRPGDQLPGIRPLAEELVINANTVAKAYRELEHEGVIELKHGAGAFVVRQGAARRRPRRQVSRGTRRSLPEAVAQLRARGLSDEEIRRLFEAELAGLTEKREDKVADRHDHRNGRSCASTYGGVDALAGLYAAGCRAARSAGSSAATAPARRRRSRCLLGMVRPSGGRGARVRPARPTTPESSVEIRRRTAFVSEDKDLYAGMTVAADRSASRRRFYPHWRSRSRAATYLAQVRAAARSRTIKHLSRGMRTKLALLLALCDAAPSS